MTGECDKKIADAIRLAAGGIYATMEGQVEDTVTLTQLNVVVLLMAYAESIEKDGLAKAALDVPVPRAMKTPDEFRGELVEAMLRAVLAHLAPKPSGAAN